MRVSTHNVRKITQVELKAAFERGRSDRRHGKGYTEIPYADARKAEAWEDGYTAELREKSRAVSHA